MKIDDKIISYEMTGDMGKLSKAASERVEKEKLLSDQQVQTQQPPEGDAIVHLSQATREANAIRDLIASFPDVREEKVARLREKIESGDYRVDHEAVADKMVDAFLDDLI